MSKSKELVVSFVKSFIANFLTFAAISISALSTDQITNPDFYTSGGLVALIGAVIRSALSETWKKTLPVSIGGKK